MTDELAPFAEIRRAAEIHGVVLDGLPTDKQSVACRLFDRAPQRQAGAALGAAEYWHGFGNAGFELGFHAGLDIDLGNFENHAISHCILARIPTCPPRYPHPWEVSR